MVEKYFRVRWLFSCAKPQKGVNCSIHLVCLQWLLYKLRIGISEDNMYIYIPGTCLSSILGVEPSKTRPKLQAKQGSFGFQVYITFKHRIQNTSNECTNLKYPEIAYKILVHISTEDDRPPDISPMAQALVTRRTRSCNKLVRWFGIPSKELWGKRKIIFKYTLGGNMLVSRRGRPKKTQYTDLVHRDPKKKRRLIIITKNHTRSRIIPPFYSK